MTWALAETENRVEIKTTRPHVSDKPLISSFPLLWLFLVQTVSNMVDMPSPVSVSDWKVSPSLLEKRQKLQSQRVSLEQRLFSFIESPLQQYTVTHKVTLQGINAEWKGPLSENHLPHGVGQLEYTDRNGSRVTYQGRMQHGVRDGRGHQVWEVSGQVYQGEWRNDSRHGRGTHIWPCGKCITGHWQNGHLHGNVCVQWPDGSSYEGTTEHGQQHGRGTHWYVNGRVYQGQYENGKEHGYGCLQEADGVSLYRGQFRNGQRQGYGLQLWPGKMYDGEWLENQVSGKGKLTWNENGACYTGEFRNGHYHGKGCFHTSNSKFVGQWKDGRKHGFGRHTTNNGKQYVGHYEYNKRHGYGRLTYTDGSCYTGGWRKGKRDGYGVHMDAFGYITHVGEWKDDQPIVRSYPSVSDDELLSRRSEWMTTTDYTNEH